MEPKKVLYSAIQPTGIITIGNYAGAIANWLKAFMPSPIRMP